MDMLINISIVTALVLVAVLSGVFCYRKQQKHNEDQRRLSASRRRAILERPEEYFSSGL